MGDYAEISVPHSMVLLRAFVDAAYSADAVLKALEKVTKWPFDDKLGSHWREEAFQGDGGQGGV